MKCGRTSSPRGKKTADEYAYARSVLDELLANVGEPHDYKFQLFLTDQREENAEARPGGYLYVARPLVRDAMKADSSKATPVPQKKGGKKPGAKTKSEVTAAAAVKEKRIRLYFALAHEVAHVTQSHEMKHLQSQIVDSITITTELYDLIKSSKEKPAAVLKYAAKATSLFAKHYAQQELHADACAVRLLHNTFANDQKVEAALQAFIGNMSKELESDLPELSRGTNAEQYVSSVLVLVKSETEGHPNTKARTENLHAMVAQVKNGKFRMEIAQYDEVVFVLLPRAPQSGPIGDNDNCPTTVFSQKASYMRGFLSSLHRQASVLAWHARCPLIHAGLSSARHSPGRIYFT